MASLRTDTSRIRVFGRRRGRKLRPGQQALLDEVLPDLLVTPGAIAAGSTAALFPTTIEALWLEIGFGAGEHLAWQAAAHPAIGFIGCEVYENGLVGLAAHVAAAGLTNIRIVRDDARLVLDALPAASVARAFILFPDPWPKARHRKRRLIAAGTLDSLARVLVDGAELRIATDDVSYLRAILAVAVPHRDFEWTARRPADWRERPADWPQTRYEAKAIAAGRAPAFLRFARKRSRASPI